VIVGLAGGACALVAARRQRGAEALPWYLFGSGILCNASGILVEELLKKFMGVHTTPNGADIFWLALYPGFIVGLAMLVYRRSSSQETGTMVLSALMSAGFSVGLGLLAWEFIMWQQQSHITFLKRVVVTAYPLADLVVVALTLRLLFSGGSRSPALLLVVGSVGCFLAADVGWAVILRNGFEPSHAVWHLLEMSSMTAFALMGAAAAQPSMAEVAAPASPTRRRGALWATLAVSTLTAPAVILLEALLDRAYSVAGN